MTINIENTLNILWDIGMAKNGIPLRYRGWVNELGLYVQLHTVSLGRDTIESLKAGGKWNPCVIAEDRGRGPWEVKKFNQHVWQTKFAHLVKPTYEITLIVSTGCDGKLSEQDWQHFLQVIQHFKKTGEWLGLTNLLANLLTPSPAKLDSERENAIKSCFKRALDFEASGNYVSAVIAYETIIEIDPVNIMAHLNRGAICLLQGKHTEAIIDFEKVINLSDNPELIQRAQRYIDEAKNR